MYLASTSQRVNEIAEIRRRNEMSAEPVTDAEFRSIAVLVIIIFGVMTTAIVAKLDRIIAILEERKK